MERRLPLWQAALWIVCGWASAQWLGLWIKTHLIGAGASDARAIVPVMFASSCVWIAVAFVAPRVEGLQLSRALDLRPAAPPVYLAAALGTVMLGPTGDALMRAMHAFFPQLSLGVVPMLHDEVRRIPLVLAWPVFALMPGVSEELMFRGLLQNAAQRRWVGIGASGIGFALLHLDPQHIAGVLPLGFFLAWVGSRCGTFVTIFAHVVNNTAAIATVHSAALDVGYGSDTPMPWPWVPASLVFVALAARVIAKHAPARAGGVPYSGPHAF